MKNNLKIEVLVSNIPEDGSIASQFPSQEYVEQQLAKKANLSPEGRLDPAQAPDYTEIPGLYEHIEDTKDEIGLSISSSLQDAKGYTNQQLSEGLRTKADLVNGKIPFDQIPFSADIEDQIQINVENITAVVDQKVAQVVEQVNGVATAANSYTDTKVAENKAYIDNTIGNVIEDVTKIGVSKSLTVPTYLTPEAGVAAGTGVAVGAYFNVRSEEDDTVAVEYRNDAGNAVATERSYLSAFGVQQQEKPASTIEDASGKNQQEINTNLGFWDGGLKSYIKYITYEALGAKFDGVTDDTAAIQMGNNFALNGFIVRAATSNGRARITSTVTFYAGEGEIDMGTSFLKPDRTIMTSGVAAIVRGNTNKIYNFGSKLRINLIGPYGEREEVAPASPTNTLRGLEIGGGTNSQASNLDLYIKVFGFRENVYVGQKSTYLLRFHSPIVGKSWYRNWTFDCVNDSGENISFLGGVGFNNVNAAKNAVDIYVTPAGQHLDLYLYGYSQDYNDVDFEMYTGIIAKFGGHNENNSLQPYAKMTYTSAMKKPCLYFTDVMIDGGNDVAQEAGNKGKPVWFEVGNGCVFKGVGGSWGKFGKMQKVKLINSAGNPLLAELSGVYFDVSANIDYIDFGKINPLINRDFATMDLSRWKNTIVSSGVVVAPTLSVENHPRLGNALKISSTQNTDNTTTRVFQKLPCSAGQLLYVATELEYSNINTTSGSVYTYYQFFDINGDEISRVRFGADLAGKTGSSTAPIVCSANVRVPSGSHSVNVGLNHFQSSGDFYMGAMQAFIQ